MIQCWYDNTICKVYIGSMGQVLRFVIYFNHLFLNSVKDHQKKKKKEEKEREKKKPNKQICGFEIMNVDLLTKIPWYQQPGHDGHM